MKKFTNWEEYGLRDFFQFTETSDIATSVAKIVSKNMLNPTTTAEAINVILLHSTSASGILNRKVITKEELFKYLHNKQVPVTTDFTKQLLIEKILQFWKQTFYFVDNESIEEPNTIPNMCPTPNMSNGEFKPTISADQPNSMIAEQFPINQMARNFATWFYDNLNSNRLQISDFFSECRCTVQFLENQQCLMEEQYSGAQAVLEFCQSLLSKYNLYLNLNISHSGTQGRIDCHGLVLVLTCVTLHKVNEFVGTFEAVFGLSRDPYSQNNWKMNQINLRLHNFNTQQQSQHSLSSSNQPTLVTSQSIVPLLNLSMPMSDDEIR